MTLDRYQFIGRLGKDAEVKQLDGGKAVIKFSVAVTEKWKDKNGEKKEKTKRIDCDLWDNSGKATVAQYIRKGNEIYIEGEPMARGWLTDAGEVKTALSVRVKEIQLLSSGKSQGQNEPRTDYPTYKEEPQDFGTSMGDADDLPF
jgi:single-strand DNA-binding protein